MCNAESSTFCIYAHSNSIPFSLLITYYRSFTLSLYFLVFSPYRYVSSFIVSRLSTFLLCLRPHNNAQLMKLSLVISLTFVRTCILCLYYIILMQTVIMHGLSRTYEAKPRYVTFSFVSHTNYSSSLLLTRRFRSVVPIGSGFVRSHLHRFYALPPFNSYLPTNDSFQYAHTVYRRVFFQWKFYSFSVSVWKSVHSVNEQQIASRLRLTRQVISYVCIENCSDYEIYDNFSAKRYTNVNGCEPKIFIVICLSVKIQISLIARAFDRNKLTRY